MIITLVRHLESTKNINEHQFSSSENNEELTREGRLFGESLSEILATYILKQSLIVTNIYCAETIRSIETAQIIARATQASVKPYPNLNSIRDTAFAGMSEPEVFKLDPEFIYQLNLYRLGLYNSFQIKHVDGNESLVDFEKRVVESITEILDTANEESIKIIVLHRSSLLATLFYFVRKFYNYPKDYYGYVQIDVGNICVLEVLNDNLVIKAINRSPYYLQQ